MSQKFNSGDLVQLKTGGPIMQVQGYDDENSKLVHCVWSIKAKSFPEKHLEDKLKPHDPNQIKVSNL